MIIFWRFLRRLLLLDFGRFFSLGLGFYVLFKLCLYLSSLLLNWLLFRDLFSLILFLMLLFLLLLYLLLFCNIITGLEEIIIHWNRSFKLNLSLICWLTWLVLFGGCSWFILLTFLFLLTFFLFFTFFGSFFSLLFLCLTLLLIKNDVFFSVANFIPELIQFWANAIKQLPLFFVVNVGFAQRIERLHHVAQIWWSFRLQV